MHKGEIHMSIGKMKNMIVLRDLPSNIIDEAIVILKPNVKIKNMNIADTARSKPSNVRSKTENRDYIINEVQMVVSNYIKTLEKKAEMQPKRINKVTGKHKTLKTAGIILGILLLISIFLM